MDLRKLGDWPEERPEENLAVVRLTTSWRQDARGVHQKKSLTFLRRKCKGFNILEHDSQTVGAAEIVPRIMNLDEVPDGVYAVVTCNAVTDWETGYAEDYDYELAPFTEEVP